MAGDPNTDRGILRKTSESDPGPTELIESDPGPTELIESEVFFPEAPVVMWQDFYKIILIPTYKDNASQLRKLSRRNVTLRGNDPVEVAERFDKIEAYLSLTGWKPYQP